MIYKATACEPSHFYIPSIVWAVMGISTVDAKIVQFDTVLGSFDVRMYSSAAPLNVANFLNYVTNNRYDGTFIYRSVPGFVIQGGGYTYDPPSNSAAPIPVFPPVVNEPGISNLRGTIAMAKLAAPADGGPPNGGPDSAANQWFINLSDSNAPNLDVQNGGFTVFGRVLGTGMNVVDAIAALPRFSLDNGIFTDVPLRAGGGANAALSNRLVFINDVRERILSDGDYNLDGVVNLADLAVWEATLGSTTRAEADGNGDGIVNQPDLDIWRAHAVPEPGTLMLTLAIAVRARRSRARKNV